VKQWNEMLSGKNNAFGPCFTTRDIDSRSNDHLPRNGALLANYALITSVSGLNPNSEVGGRDMWNFTTDYADYSDFREIRFFTVSKITSES